MVNRELIEVFSEIAREKNVERSELATILEELFLYVIEKEYGDSSNCSCIVNIDKGEIEIYSEKTIVEEVDDYKIEITLAEAIEKEPEAIDLELGILSLRLLIQEFLVADWLLHKTVFAQRLRISKGITFMRTMQTDGEIIIGVVHQTQRDGYVNIEQAELRMPRSDRSKQKDIEEAIQ